MTATLGEWTAESLSEVVRRSVERLRRAPGVRHVAVMPDVHLARDVCVGVALATDGRVFPAAVGRDIGCGVSTVSLGVLDVGGEPALRRVLARWSTAAPIKRQASLATCPEMSFGALRGAGLDAKAKREGRIELGTLGRGNHFLELQVDDAGAAWLMVHSGSRAMGQAISDAHGVHAQRAGSLAVLDGARADAYVEDVAWGVRYAAANRRLMLERAAAVVADEIGATADWTTFVDTTHNHARAERVGEVELIVHRKGAAPAAAGERGLIPGCMGGWSYHVEGRGVEAALRSSSHGAGRAMSRSEAARRVDRATFERSMRGVVYDERLRLRDEAPAAYKDVEKVMRAQRDLVKIVRRVKGNVVYKGS